MRSYVLRSFVPAAIGCALGYQWAIFTNQTAHMGLYATAGATVGLLMTRLAALIWTITVDFRQE